MMDFGILFGRFEVILEDIIYLSLGILLSLVVFMMLGIPQAHVQNDIVYFMFLFIRMTGQLYELTKMRQTFNVKGSSSNN